MARAARNPDELIVELLEDLERQVRALARRKPKAIRIDADDGAHVILGSFADGSVGLRVYNNAGVLVHDLTAT